MQQGRVTLEADWNEAQMIATEEERLEALDFVGPAGTPDDGYPITLPSSGFDLDIGKGTMYVGGVRTSLAASEVYSAQPDWLDAAIDPAFVPVPTATPATNEYVYLRLREQEVSAVEDSDLKDVALGGPDTAQRTRLIQHVERLATRGTDCPSAFKDSHAAWAAAGFSVNSADFSVHSFARLQVGFVSTAPATPCDPSAQGGYLGADNQLIRVQISTSATGALTLLWGYDDASFLYRVNVSDPQTLILQSAPVDANHIPQGGQAVEVLMDAALLSNGQYVAAPVGQVFTLATSSYNADSRALTLPTALPVVYGDGTSAHKGPPQVYLRVWQQQLPFTPGTPVTLGDTGVQVTITTSGGTAFRAGDFWMFAVRPDTPQQIYPARYLAAPQPPDGPREWLCPLAVILWSTSPATVISCRLPFDNLVELTARQSGGSCCEVSVSAADHNSGKLTIQMAIDSVLPTGGKVCLGIGTFNLASTVTISGAQHAIVLTGDGAGPMFAKGSGVTTLIAPSAAADAVTPSIFIDGSDGVTIQNLQIDFAPGTQDPAVLAAGGATGHANPAIMIQNSTLVTVQGCSLVCTGNTLATAAAIAIGGIIAQTAIQDNILQFDGLGAGIIRLDTVPVNKGTPLAFCLTFDLYIRRNVMQCGTGGVLFDDAFYHAAQLDVSHNFIGPCALAGIAIGSLGVAAPLSRVEIANNEIVGIGAGISCGVTARIADNDLILSPPATPAATDVLLSGIVLTVPAFKTPFADGLQITGNRIGPAAGFGIYSLAQLGSATITGNLIDGPACGGIFSQGGADKLTITGNQLINLVPSSARLANTIEIALGIFLFPVAVNGKIQELGYAEIEGNILKDFATDAVGSVTRLGIAVYGHKSARISGNQLINLGPANSAVNGSVGIAAGVVAFDRLEVTNNVVRRSDTVTAEVNSDWIGIDVTGPKQALNKLQASSKSALFNAQIIDTANSGPILVTAAGLATYSTGGLQAVSLRGNFVDIAGSSPAVKVNIGGTCTFTDNQCNLATANRADFIAELAADTVVASNNILEGGVNRDSTSLEITASGNKFSVLGNVVAGIIKVNNAALAAPWNTLNIM
jgi:hypothetical protein